MSKHLERDLEALEREILDQSSRVEEMIAKACQALLERRGDIAAEVAANELQINVREVKIEEECLKILALHQPVAVDLRRTATVLKINTELERIADLAVNIAERTISLAEFPEFEIPDKLERMFNRASEMVRESLDAFVDQNVDAARDVCRRDDEVDEYNRRVIDDLLEVMRSRPELVEAAVHFFSVCRHVERIGDCATNIAEDVIYLVEGEIARHHFENAHYEAH
ncbi:MAG: phosphate signaling complex protein PhoU [Pirellulales bacterium]|nr:phosphate signaling complex protein PhoU [Pirellulales bacterium]